MGGEESDHHLSKSVQENNVKKILFIVHYRSGGDEDLAISKDSNISKQLCRKLPHICALAIWN